MELGTKIRILREAKNISREQMSDWLNLSLSTYKKVENGEREPSVSEISILSEKLGVHPSYFYNNVNYANISNGDNSPGVGVGNIVAMDKQMLECVTTLIDQNKKNQESICKALDQNNAAFSQIIKAVEHFSKTLEELQKK